MKPLFPEAQGICHRPRPLPQEKQHVTLLSKPINAKHHNVFSQFPICPRSSTPTQPSRRLDFNSNSTAQIVQYQASMIIDDDEKSHDSGSGSSESSDRFEVLTQLKLIRLEQDTLEYEFTKKMFAAGMESAGVDAKVVAIHKNMHSGWTRGARWESFKVFQKTVAQKCGGNANIGYGWYGATKNQITGILLHGFSASKGAVGIELFANNYSYDGAMSSDADENGLRHILLCRVILGNRELVVPGSKQVNPSSEEFDSGVDCLVNPKRFIIWSNFMNSHIMPISVLSFKAPANLKDIPRTIQANVAAVRPPARSAWLNLPDLLDALAKVVPPPVMVLISKSAYDFKAKKITRPQLMRRVKNLAGEKLLVSVLKKERE